MKGKERSKLLAAIRESMGKSGGCCGSDGSCNCSSEPQEKREDKK